MTKKLIAMLLAACTMLVVRAGIEETHDVYTSTGLMLRYFFSGEDVEICQVDCWHLDEDGKRIIEEPYGDIDLPDVVEGHPVKGIYDYAFYNVKRVTSIKIPNGSEYIGEYAFHGCSNLEKVMIPDSVMRISGGAFDECSNSLFDTTTIPGVTLVDGWAVSSSSSLSGHLDLIGIRGIANGAFRFKDLLQGVTIPNGVKSIGSTAFLYCRRLKNVEIPESVTWIGNDAFAVCDNLVLDTTTIPYVKLLSGWVLGFEDSISGDLDLTLARGIVDGCTFSNRTRLTSVTMPDHVTSIRHGMFYGCTSLTNITVPASINNIGSDAFRDCRELKEIIVPDGVTIINARAFWGCSSLTNVAIPSGLTKIGIAAFYGCSGLLSFSVAEGNPHYESMSGLLVEKNPNSEDYTLAQGVNGDVAIPEGIRHIKRNAFAGLANLHTVVFPNSLRSIGAFAFAKSGLEKIDLKDGLEIEIFAFAECENLKDVTIGADVRFLPKDGTLVFEDWWGTGWEGHTVDEWVTGKVENLDLIDVQVDEIEVYPENGAICIGAQTFAWFPWDSSFNSLFNNEFSNWNNIAFPRCHNIVNLKIDNSSLTEQYYFLETPWGALGEVQPSFSYIFGKDSLTNVKSLEVTNIQGKEEYDLVDGQECINCFSCLEELSLPSNSEFRGLTNGGKAFFSLPYLRSLKNVPPCSLESFRFCSMLTNIVIGTGPYWGIPDNCFPFFVSLEKVVIPDSIRSVDETAFLGCSASLYDTTSIPGVKLVDGWVVGYSGSLNGVLDLTGARGIADAAFKGCEGLTKVVIPETVHLVPTRAFKNCVGLEEVVFSGNPEPRTLPDLGLNWFYCIESEAFMGCSRLRKIDIPKGVYRIGDYAFAYCEGLSSVLLPEGLVEIGECAFAYNDSLTSIIIPDTVKKVRIGAFAYCKNLKNALIPRCICDIPSTYYGTDYSSSTYSEWDHVSSGISFVFGCESMPIYSGSSYNGTVIQCPCNPALTNVVVASGTALIADSAFADCKNLQSVTIPASVTRIGDGAFRDCAALTSMVFEGDAPDVGSSVLTGTPRRLEVVVQPGSVGWSSGASTNLPDNWCDRGIVYSDGSGTGGSGSGSGSGDSAGTEADARYELSNTVKDRAIASVTVDGDCAIDEFVLKDGKVYDCVLYVNNTAESEVTLSLPAGNIYKAFKGAKPLKIPAKSQHIITITRVDANTFLVSREELETLQ